MSPVVQLHDTHTNQLPFTSPTKLTHAPFAHASRTRGFVL